MFSQQDTIPAIPERRPLSSMTAALCGAIFLPFAPGLTSRPAVTNRWWWTRLRVPGLGEGAGSHPQLTALRQHIKEPRLRGEGGPADGQSQPASVWVRLSGSIQDHQLPDVCSSGVTQIRPVQTADPQNLGQVKLADSKPGVKPPLQRKSCHTPLHTLTCLLLYTSLLPKKNHTVCQLIPPHLCCLCCCLTGTCFISIIRP